MKDVGKPKSKRKITCITVLLVFVMLLMYSGMVFANENETVRVGYFLMKGYEEGEDDEIKAGYGYEYLQAIRNYTGWNYEYVYGSWDELLEMLERGEIDIMSHVAYTSEREGKYLFSTESQGTESNYIFVRGDNKEFNNGDFSKLDGKIVGIRIGDYRAQVFLDWCSEQNIQCNIVEYSDTTQMHKDLEEGKIDAINESRVAMSAYSGDWKSILRLDNRKVYFAINKNRPDLLDKVNEAQSKILSINEFYGEDLLNKYKAYYSVSAFELTDDEQKLIENYGTITVGYCENRQPLAFTDEKTGELSGLVKDYMDNMYQTYGVKFKAVSYPNEFELIGALLDKKIDIAVPGAYSSTTAEKHSIVLSDTINQAAMVAVYKGYEGTDTKNIFDRIAVVSNSISERDYAQRYYPDAVLVEAESECDAINMVQEGKVDSYIMRSSYWSWFSEGKTRLKDLYVVSLKYPAEIIVSMREEDADMMVILNKSIALMDDSKRVQAIVRYSYSDSDMTIWDVVRENPFTTVLIAFVLILIFILCVALNRLLMEAKYIKKLKNAKDEAEEARQQAERANKAKSTFMTSMSHDIRTPMNAIIGMTTLAIKHIDEQDYIRNCLNKITMASNHLLTLINDVLDINKIESGNLSMNPTVFSLADSIMNLANISRPQINEKNHSFEIRVHNIEHEFIFADELRINQIFINILSNAVKYTPAKGQITVDIKSEKIQGESDKIRLIYIVKDNGIGMSEEFQQKMYDIFAMEGKQGYNFNGSGVGLAICKHLVDLLDGTIECESSLGKGTTFTVTLELSIADKLADNRMLPPISILLVDDDEIFRMTASETLKDMGVTPDCADSGETAIAIVKERHDMDRDYPVIIVDWKMPGMDGMETTKQIRSIVGEDVSIIVVSAYDFSDIRDDAIKAGANGFISKPFFRSSVYENLSEVLGIKVNDTKEENRKSSLQGLRLLVAEDNDFNWEIAKEFLAMQGVTATRAENGKLCLELLNNSPDGTYEMILMDIQMPEMNGYETAEAIRCHERLYIRNIPIIAMTADAFTEDVAHCIEVGMNAHMAKPLNLEQFVEIIEKINLENKNNILI